MNECYILTEAKRSGITSSSDLAGYLIHHYHNEILYNLFLKGSCMDDIVIKILIGGKKYGKKTSGTNQNRFVKVFRSGEKIQRTLDMGDGDQLTLGDFKGL